MQPELASTPAASALASEPHLNERQQRLVDSLRANGVALLRFQELFGEALWREAEADIEPFVRATADATRDAGATPTHKRDVIVRRFEKREGEKRPVLRLNEPWLRFAASETLLDVINAYRGRWTKLFYLDNWYTVPFPGLEERVASQRWHRDPEEEHVVKVFVYFSEVDADAGPFEYVSGSASGQRHGDLWPWGVADRYPPPDELEQTVPPADRLMLTGPPGTMIVCDTGGFHRGGFARTRPRVLAACTYVDPDAT